MASKKPRHQRFQSPKKSPIATRGVESQKVPRTAVSIDSYHHLRPSWRVSNIELAEPYGWTTVSATTLLFIREKLANFETMTWSEILVKAKKQNHSIRVSDISAEAQLRLEEKGLALDEVVSLRLTGKERVFGYLESGVLVLLWWDPNHEVCPSLKD